MNVETRTDSEWLTRRSRWRAAPITRVVGGLLCLAAVLKLLDLYDSSFEGIEAKVAMAGSSVELLIGAALVFRLWPSISVPAAGLLLIFLTATSLIGTARGAPRCGCLGAIPMPPWAMLIFDATAVLVLGWEVWTSGRLREQQFLTRAAACCIGSLFVGVASGSIIYPRPGVVTKNLSVEVIAESKIFAISPNRFRGRPFFLIPFIRIDADLSQGEWKVILTRPGCRKCDRMLGSGGCRPEGTESVAVVLADENKGETAKGWIPPEGCKATVGHLNPDKTWLFEPPMIFRLRNGRVIETL